MRYVRFPLLLSFSLFLLGWVINSDFPWVLWAPGTDIGCCRTSGKDDSFGLKHIYVGATAQISRPRLSAPLLGLLCFLIKLFTLAEIYDTVFKWESVVSASLLFPAFYNPL